MDIVGKAIAVLGTAGHAAPETERIRQRLARDGAQVYVVVLGRPGPTAHAIGLEEAQEIWFDALLIPDGPNAAPFAADEACLEFVTQFEIDAKPIAAIGHGILVLVAAELVAGRRIATLADVRDQVEAEGGRVADDALVEDEMWITAQRADRLDDLLDRLVASMRRIHLAARDSAGPLDS